MSPHLLAPKAALSLKCLLQHQPWNDTKHGGPGYTLEMPESDDDPDLARIINEQIGIIEKYVII